MYVEPKCCRASVLLMQDCEAIDGVVTTSIVTTITVTRMWSHRYGRAPDDSLRESLEAERLQIMTALKGLCVLLAPVVSTGRRNTLSQRGDGVYVDGSKISSRVHCGREDGVMGSLEARGIAEGDWTSFWQAVIVDLGPKPAMPTIS